MVEYVIQIKRRITTNAGVSVKIKKNIICAKNIIFAIVLHVVVKIVNMSEVLFKYTCDEIIEETKTVTTKQAPTNLYILLAILLITIAFLRATSFTVAS